MTTTLPSLSKRPPLLVVAIHPLPDAGSEFGKGFQWTRALGEFFEVHLVCNEDAVRPCLASPLTRDWRIHPLRIASPTKFGLSFYPYYYHWCRAVTERCRELIPVIRPVGLHHTTLGSFRLLPAYETLGLPYSLGPLGGGETAPWSVLRHAGLPFGELLKEGARGWINQACADYPPTRRTLHSARRVIATTRETETLLRGAGARDTAVVFPDVLEFALDPAAIRARRAAQMANVTTELQCVWSGRFLWWKGGQLALQMLARARQRGVRARLDIFSAGPGIDRLKARAAALGLGEAVAFRGFVPRTQLLEAYAQAHVYIYPTLHDSSSSAIPEAYSTGLPTITLGLGGAGLAAAPDAGLNEPVTDIDAWLERGAALFAAWQADPARWLAASDAAAARAGAFSFAQLAGHVGRHLAPLYI